VGIRSLIFTPCLIIALAVFFRRLYLLSAMVFLGQAENRYDHFRARLKSLLIYGFGQGRVVEEPFGFNHFLLFWGFILLQATVNIEFIINGIFPAFSLRFIGDTAYALLSLVADVTSYLVLAVVIIAVIRRLFFRPWYIEARPPAFLILILVALLMAGDGGMHIALLSNGESAVRHFPVSHLVSVRLADMGIGWKVIFNVSWWLHGAVLLLFICYIPYSKHLHILTALPNCFFRRLSFPSSMPRLLFRKGEIFGVSSVVQFTWKDLYDFLSCTECGRCANMCPATDTGKALNPMEVVLEGKANLLANGMEILRSRSYDSFERADKRTATSTSLIGPDKERQVRPEAIWDCTTCGACVEKCPVFIEQFPRLSICEDILSWRKLIFLPSCSPFLRTSSNGRTHTAWHRASAGNGPMD